MSGSGLEALPDVRECSGGPPRCPGVFGRLAVYPEEVGRPSRMSGSGREPLPDVQEWSRQPPGCPGEVGRPSRMAGSGREAL